MSPTKTTEEIQREYEKCLSLLVKKYYEDNDEIKDS